MKGAQRKNIRKAIFRQARDRNGRAHGLPCCDFRFLYFRFSPAVPAAAIWWLSFSMASSNLCCDFQKFAHKSPFFSRRPGTVRILKSSGRRLLFNSLGSTGVETGAFGNARTE